MKYSVIVPSYNSESTIARCLEALTQQRFEESSEIVVVDSSNDATPEIIRKHFPQIRLIHLDQRTDSYTARNIGIRQSHGEILCFIDSDCLARSDWLCRIAATHNEHAEYAAVGGSVANGNPGSSIGWAGYFAEFREFFPFHPKQLIANIPTCNISYKRRVFEQYGEFQDVLPPGITIRHPQQGDLVFNLKLGAHQERIFFDPEIQVAHINMTTLTRFVGHQYRLGRITSVVLKQFPKLRGSFIARSAFFSIAACPVLPLVKFLNTFRIAALSRDYLFAFVRSAPLLLLGLLFWEAGFLRGVFLHE
ncbi:hypothetical protein CSB45_04405 [candidate division KSB3 bacterium]|uniref:Glycosyltransferase 2-like domain-containing protein n=1 Tax=candidate division KSB3 bacterium TaxID=2044937 RepID=A0A2G6E8F0_9BACT|nr:MAG: hypothetical protein CSB45_04405 [candidate division KSB3 bacterium]PIE30619.1 MAG: hypothetical protein CSA57_02990 [candidate division KSB3 bacterium]